MLRDKIIPDKSKRMDFLKAYDGNYNPKEHFKSLLCEKVTIIISNFFDDRVDTILII